MGFASRKGSELPPTVPRDTNQQQQFPESTSYANSYHERSYNSWRYVDEASLYSIAEDSRENFSERAPSEVGGFNDVGMNSSVTGGFPGYGDLEEPSSNTRVEVKWLEGDLDDMCSGGGALGPHTPSTKRSATQDHDEEDFLFPCYTSSSRRRRKRTAIVAGVCLGALVLLSVVIGVSISQTAGKSGSRTSQTPIVGDPNTGGGDKGPAEEDPQTDTAGPTAAPSWSNKAQIAEYAYSYVLSALGDCTPNEVLTDSSTPQGQIFLDLVEEVASQVTVSDSGNGAEGEDPSSGQEPPSQQFVLSPIHLHDYLIEKYALRMFFHTTTEQRWKLSIYWNSNQDLCDWSGVLCNTLNHEGTCSIYSLNLIGNKLKGQIPEELCCMPCLNSLSLANNELYGQVPSCLSSTGWYLDLAGNNFSGAGASSIADIESTQKTTP